MRRQYDTMNGECATCGGDPVRLGPPLAIVYSEMQIHRFGVDACRERRFVQCPWCASLRARLVERGDGAGYERRWECPTCYPMPPELRAEIILRRDGGEPPWRAGE